MLGDLLEWKFCFQWQKIRLESFRDLPGKLVAEGTKAATNSARKWTEGKALILLGAMSSVKTAKNVEKKL